MKLTHVALAGLFALSVSIPATAEEKYGTAGCGLGSIVIGNDPGIVQIFAVTTNATGIQTFGITSGTSNCDDTAGGQTSAKAFVETNRVALSKDMARGRGETIASLSQLAGCADAAAVGRSLQKNFKRVFPKAGVRSSQVGDSVITILRTDKALACSAVG
ncbi:MAG: DUF3015 family protein [Polyangiaceae bacterium]|nr:DUF3015 family protein [Polyangiaceae bacterium]